MNEHVLKIAFVVSVLLLAPYILGAQNQSIQIENRHPQSVHPQEGQAQNTHPQSVVHKIRQLSLQECIATGLENNYGIRIARNEQQIAANNATRGNAGQLPTLELGATLGGSYYDTDYRTGAEGVRSDNTQAYYVDVGPTLGWTLFNGFSASANYKRLKELSSIGELEARLATEELAASIAAEYYTLIRQQDRLRNLQALVNLSAERVRITEASFSVGASSGLDYQQAKVDFNADNSSLISQIETVQEIEIEMNEMMGIRDVARPVFIADTAIVPNVMLGREKFMGDALEKNSSLLIAKSNRRVSELDLKRVRSRNYPYLNLSGGYGYRHSWDNYSSYDSSNRLGFNFGVSAGITIFDSKRRTEQRNARLEVENRQLYIESMELAIESEMSSLWLAYTNNIKLWNMERDNLEVARINFEISMERYRLNELSGIELREAQLSLLESEERLSIVEYNIKMSEISLYLLSGNIFEIMK